MPDSDAIRAHVERILASPGFSSADRLRRFLTYTVEATLKGESAQIKEYLLGRDVFDRDENYDPRLDPIVRVEARRLRKRLDEYYAGPGNGEKLRIEFPKGSYAPVITTLAAPTRNPGRLVLAVSVLAVAAAAFWFFRQSNPENAVAIVPARWTFVDPSGLDAADEPLAEAVTKHAANRGRVPVVGWPTILPFRTRPAKSPDLAIAVKAAMVLAVSVRDSNNQARVTVFLVEPSTGRKRWAEDFYAQDLKSPAAIEALAQTIAQDLEIVLGRAN